MMLRCWKEHPEERPPFSELSHSISGFLEALAGYFDFNFNPFATHDVEVNNIHMETAEETQSEDELDLGQEPVPEIKIYIEHPSVENNYFQNM